MAMRAQIYSTNSTMNVHESERITLVSQYLQFIHLPFTFFLMFIRKILYRDDEINYVAIVKLIYKPIAFVL